MGFLTGRPRTEVPLRMRSRGTQNNSRSLVRVQQRELLGNPIVSTLTYEGNRRILEEVNFTLQNSLILIHCLIHCGTPLKIGYFGKQKIRYFYTNPNPYSSNTKPNSSPTIKDPHESFLNWQIERVLEPSLQSVVHPGLGPHFESLIIIYF